MDAPYTVIEDGIWCPTVVEIVTDTDTGCRIDRIVGMDSTANLATVDEIECRDKVVWSCSIATRG